MTTTLDAIPNPFVEPVAAADTLPVRRPGGRPEAGEIDVAGHTDRGRVRARNEDHFAIADLERWVGIRESSAAGALPGHGEHAGSQRLGSHGLLLAVADGMGGRAGGELASSVVLGALVRHAAQAVPWAVSSRRDEHRAVLGALETAVERAQARLWREADQRGLGEQRPGTTLTAAYVCGPMLYLAHVGDSRCYLLREGALSQLTRDHTVAQRLVDADAMSEREAAVSRLSSVLYNAVGGSRERAVPDLLCVDLHAGDQLLLCTDGVTDLIDDRAIADVLERADSARAASCALVDAACDAGGRDNATAVVARL